MRRIRSEATWAGTRRSSGTLCRSSSDWPIYYLDPSPPRPQGLCECLHSVGSVHAGNANKPRLKLACCRYSELKREKKGGKRFDTGRLYPVIQIKQYCALIVDSPVIRCTKGNNLLLKYNKNNDNLKYKKMIPQETGTLRLCPRAL